MSYERLAFWAINVLIGIVGVVLWWKSYEPATTSEALMRNAITIVMLTTPGANFVFVCALYYKWKGQ